MGQALLDATTSPRSPARTTSSGRLFDDLKKRGLWDGTFVLALADHGEAFGEHGGITHGTYCYETTLHVPLIARWPASAGGRRAGTRSREARQRDGRRADAGGGARARARRSRASTG